MRPKPKPVEPVIIAWATQAQFFASVSRDGLKLGVVCQLMGSKWQVLALTTPDATTTVDELFENHAHKVVGFYDSPTEALTAAESFARAWHRDFKATRANDCTCEEMRNNDG